MNNVKRKEVQFLTTKNLEFQSKRDQLRMSEIDINQS